MWWHYYFMWWQYYLCSWQHVIMLLSWQPPDRNKIGQESPAKALSIALLKSLVFPVTQKVFCNWKELRCGSFAWKWPPQSSMSACHMWDIILLSLVALPMQWLLVCVSGCLPYVWEPKIHQTWLWSKRQLATCELSHPCWWWLLMVNRW